MSDCQFKMAVYSEKCVFWENKHFTFILHTCFVKFMTHFSAKSVLVYLKYKKLKSASNIVAVM